MPTIICLKNNNGIACASDLPILLEKNHFFFVSLEACSYTSFEDLSLFVKGKEKSSVFVYYDQENKTIQSNCPSVLMNTRGSQLIETSEDESLDDLRKKAISYISSPSISWVLFDQYGNTGSNL